MEKTKNFQDLYDIIGDYLTGTIKKEDAIKVIDEFKEDKRINPKYKHFETQGMLDEMKKKIEGL